MRGIRTQDKQFNKKSNILIVKTLGIIYYVVRICALRSCVFSFPDFGTGGDRPPVTLSRWCCDVPKIRNAPRREIRIVARTIRDHNSRATQRGLLL